MLKQLLYILIALFVVFVVVNSGWRYFKRKKRQAAKRIRNESPDYIALENEKDKIKQKRLQIENEHPYQRIVSLRLKLKTAIAKENKNIIQKIENEIEGILAEYENIDEKRLREAYIAQLEAMNVRLNKIEIEQRIILIKAEKII
ncbi:hypothetical protein KAH81_04850 [bacterium]|nr:hypothetical protein [bacterium]